MTTYYWNEGSALCWGTYAEYRRAMRRIRAGDK